MKVLTLILGAPFAAQAAAIRKLLLALTESVL
jgi:hypothetical protein